MADADLQLILARDAGQRLCLWACRGAGKGCTRNLHRRSKAPCVDCLGPLPATMTLEEVLEKLERGDA